MSRVLLHVAKKEKFHLPDEASQNIINTSNGNLRKALLVFEAMKMQRPDLIGDIEVAKPDWETYCTKVADLILQEQTAQRLLEVRGKIYELLSHCIPPQVVLKTVAERIVDKVDDTLKPQIIHWAAYYVGVHTCAGWKLTKFRNCG
jgi:replication factor C subunit 3/5